MLCFDSTKESEGVTMERHEENYNEKRKKEFGCLNEWKIQ